MQSKFCTKQDIPGSSFSLERGSLAVVLRTMKATWEMATFICGSKAGGVQGSGLSTPKWPLHELSQELSSILGTFSVSVACPAVGEAEAW